MILLEATSCFILRKNWRAFYFTAGEKAKSTHFSCLISIIFCVIDSILLNVNYISGYKINISYCKFYDRKSNCSQYMVWYTLINFWFILSNIIWLLVLKTNYILFSIYLQFLCSYYQTDLMDFTIIIVVIVCLYNVLFPLYN